MNARSADLCEIARRHLEPIGHIVNCHLDNPVLISDHDVHSSDERLKQVECQFQTQIHLWSDITTMDDDVQFVGEHAVFRVGDFRM